MKLSLETTVSDYKITPVYSNLFYNLKSLSFKPEIRLHAK